MPIPPNRTAATATQIGVGSTVTQEVDDGTTVYTVWYTFTAIQSSPMVGVWALGSLSLNGSALSVFTGPASSPVPYPPSTSIASAVNVPVQFPVTQGTTYYLEIVPTNTDKPASVTLSVVALAPADAPVGSFFIPPAQAAFSGVILSESTSNLALNATLFPASQPIDVLPTTGLLAATVPSTTEVQIFTPQFTLAATAVLASAFTPPTFIRQAQGVFWVGSASGSGNAARAVSVSASGVIGGTTYVFGPNTSGLLAGFAVDPTTAIIYFSGVTGSTNQPIKRWSIATNMAMSDLVAGVVGDQTGPLLCLADGSIVAAYNSVPVTAMRYSAAGATLNTYTFIGSNGEIGGLASALDDPNSFWIDTLSTDGVTHTLSNVTASSGSILAAVTYPEFAQGAYTGTPTASPAARFGADPAVGGFVILRVLVPATIGGPVTLALRRERTVPLPVLAGNARQTVSRLEIQFQPGTGIPASPNQAPQFFAQISWDNGQTWSNERLMSAGREGAYLTRAFLNGLGAGRFPVVRIVTTDTFVPVLTDAFAWVTPGVH